MPNIDSSLIPLVTPGNTFTVLTDNETLAVRWLTAQDPHFFDTYNRPMADIVVRQLILAKSIDQLGLRLGHQTNFPFLVEATVDVSSATLSLPASWIWDTHPALSDDWENLRLAVIQRYPGESNIDTSTYTGIMRLVFTANPVGSSTEVGIFYVDYEIDSSLSFQIRTIKPCTEKEYPTSLPTEEWGSIAGFVTFRTLDTEGYSEFFAALAPSSDSTGTEGNPENYEITDTPAGGEGVDGDYSYTAVSHGTGMLVNSAYNVIPPIGVTANSVLTALNYPWRYGTSLTSTDQKSTIPDLLFNSFILTAPMGDRFEAEKENFEVYCTKIRRLDSSANQLKMYFSTNDTIIGSTSEELIEFATVILNRNDQGTGGPGTVIEIVPANNLRNNNVSDAELFYQNFGSGHVILSSEWATDSSINDFFDSFLDIVDEPADRFFNAQLNEFGLHRTPQNIPTLGEDLALQGSTSRREDPINPSDDNRYVTEYDQGLGDKVDFREYEDIEDNDDINPEAYKGSVLIKSVVLLVNTANNARFNYTDDILPRLKVLLGRDPIHGDEWFDGTIFKRYDGISESWIG